MNLLKTTLLLRAREHLFWGLGESWAVAKLGNEMVFLYVPETSRATKLNLSGIHLSLYLEHLGTKRSGVLYPNDQHTHRFRRV